MKILKASNVVMSDINHLVDSQDLNLLAIENMKNFSGVLFIAVKHRENIRWFLLRFDSAGFNTNTKTII